MHPVEAWIVERREEMIALLGEMAECESPSDDAAAVERFQQLLAGRLAGFAKARMYPSATRGAARNLRLDFALPGPKRKRPGRLLAVGHADTVWRLGTLRQMPLRRADGRLWGPGVLDMKGGLALFIYALKALEALDIPVGREVTLWVVSDEEVGSRGSREQTEKLAQEARAVLVLEPSTGLEGKLKTARKGVGIYHLRVHGKAAHSGVDFSAGASAIVEIARQVGVLAGFTDLKKGVTVNPGIIAGGTRTNVVAAEARADVDVRVTKLRDAARLERRILALKPFDKRCKLEISGGLNRPPMERDANVRALFGAAREIAWRELGVELDESVSGGGSDGNFTAALGVPTLDGIGAVGEGIHAPHESVVIERMAGRAALLALLVRHLGE